jgi:hypothetical protein
MDFKSQDKPTPNRKQSDSQQLVLPPLTPATIQQRAEEGVAAARDLNANCVIDKALFLAEVIVEGGSDQRMSSELRAFCVRALIRTLFRVKVKYPERIPNTPALLASNHLNHIDPFLLLSELPARPYYYILDDARTLYNK